VPAFGHLRAADPEAEPEPADSASRVAAVIAVIAGVRAGICSTALPMSIVFVRAATQASTVTASDPYASAAHTTE
jgi:hypothetical protein